MCVWGGAIRIPYMTMNSQCISLILLFVPIVMLICSNTFVFASTSHAQRRSCVHMWHAAVVWDGMVVCPLKVKSRVPCSSQVFCQSLLTTREWEERTFLTVLMTREASIGPFAG